MRTHQKPAPSPARRTALRPSPAAKRKSAPAYTHRLSRLLVALTGFLVFAAVCVVGWAWWQTARPGAAHLREGQAAYDMQQYPLAEQNWLAGVRADPGYLPLRVRLGDFYVQQKHYGEAETQYEAATRLNAGDGNLYLKLNRAALAKGDSAIALAAAKQAAALRPNDPDAQGLLGILADMDADTPDAMRALTRAHTLRPNDRDYFLRLMMLKMRLSEMPAAHVALTQWLQTHRGDPMASHMLAVTDEHYETDPATLNQAIALEQVARAGMPGDVRVYMTLGQLDLAAHKAADALQAYRDGLKIDSHSEDMLHGVVRSATMLGETKAAEAAAQELQTETMRHQEITHLGDQIRLSRDNEKFVLEQAQLRLADGDSLGAMEDYRYLLSRNSGDMGARAALKAFYVHLGRHDLAKDAMQPDFVP